MLAKNALFVFYAGQGRLRTVTVIANMSAPPSPSNYYSPPDVLLHHLSFLSYYSSSAPLSPPPLDPCMFLTTRPWQVGYLDDPYEGELFTWFVDLYSMAHDPVERYAQPCVEK